MVHSCRVGLFEWHPTAAKVIFSTCYNYKVIVWNLDTKESILMSPMKTIYCHQDMILFLSFKWQPAGHHL